MSVQISKNVVEQFAIDSLELHSFKCGYAQLLAIVVEDLLKKLKLLNLINHEYPLLPDDLDDLTCLGPLVVYLVFLGHIYFIGSFQRSLEA